MAITVGIIQGKAPDGSGNGGVTEAQLSAPIVDFISPGARDAASMRVDPPGASARQVIIKAGRYYAPNATGTMVYVVDLDTDYTLNLATNGAGNPRISAIVLKIDKAITPNIYADNVASFVEVQGSAAGSPTAPSDSTIQSGVGAGNVGVRLADVTLSAGYVTVTSPNIADKRTGAAVNGSKVKLIEGHTSASSSLALTTTLQDVAGTSVTFTLPTASVVRVSVTFDFDGNTAVTAGDIALGYLSVDGSNQTEACLLKFTTNSARSTVSRTFRLVLGAGSHTLKLQAANNAHSAGIAWSPHSGLDYWVVSQ